MAKIPVGICVCLYAIQLSNTLFTHLCKIMFYLSTYTHTCVTHKYTRHAHTDRVVMPIERTLALFCPSFFVSLIFFLLFIGFLFGFFLFETIFFSDLFSFWSLLCSRLKINVAVCLSKGVLCVWVCVWFKGQTFQIIIIFPLLIANYKETK